MKNHLETAIKYILISIFTVAMLTGCLIISQGISGIPETGLISQASVDNELRFMTVYWFAFGLYCFSISKNINEKKKNIFYIALILFSSGIARLLSYLFVGQPLTIFYAAMLLELVLPVVLIVLLLLYSKAKDSPAEPFAA